MTKIIINISRALKENEAIYNTSTVKVKKVITLK